ncbi:hypothetical protein DXU93_05915 [Brumimicrobium aurantiacum]|uniref:Uncharacterized protein n=2 Tax=Brumimicrobium aurantiacum TaxID=1737063 RepID=A0A3E1EY98_9FLAO|nr:hypothetical protein DXU93_05915 [Brumimicrobium aurantiacum]
MLYGVFMDVEHGCDTNDLPEVKSGHDCCNPSSDDEVKIDVDCCTSKVEVYQIDSDLATNDIHIEFAKNFDCDFVHDNPSYAIERQKFSIFNKAPPVLTTLKRLSLFQMYLI